jgi:SAM-dependent methyltransferase
MDHEGLHTAMLPFLRHVLLHAPPASPGWILDLACGKAEKWPLYHELFGATTRIVGVDNDPRYGMLHSSPSALVIADAHTLPFTNSCFSGVLCIAALSLFTDPQAVLREIKRVLQRDAALLVVTAEQRWVQIWQWEKALVTRIAAAYGAQPLPMAHPDTIGNLSELLQQAAFQQHWCAAALLEYDYPLAVAALALLPWPLLAPILSSILTPHELAACQASPCEIEVCSIVMAGWAIARNGQANDCW